MFTYWIVFQLCLSSGGKVFPDCRAYPAKIKVPVNTMESYLLPDGKRQGYKQPPSPVIPTHSAGIGFCLCKMRGIHLQPAAVHLP